MVNFLFYEVLDCTGRGFHPDWSRLHKLASSPEQSPAEAAALATALVARWRNHSVEGCKRLPEVLLGEGPLMRFRGFCPYGYAAALHVASWGVPRPRRAGKAKVRKLLDEALACLSMGDKWWTWNFHADTRWQSLLSTLELMSKRPRRLRPRQVVVDRTVQGRYLESGFVVSYASEPSRPSSDRYLQEYRRQLTAGLAQRLPPARVSKDGRVDLGNIGKSSAGAKRLQFSAFGVHTTTLLEPMFALRKVLPADMALAFALFGASHPPPDKLVSEVCPSIDAGHLPPLRCFNSFYPSADWWLNLVDRPRLQPALDELAEMVGDDKYIRESDCLICGGGNSPTLCLMLRMVTDLPMLITLQAPLTFRMPRGADQRALLVAFFREMARGSSPAASGRTVTSTSLIFLQRQVWAQTGCLLPVVRNHNWYAADSLAWPTRGGSSATGVSVPWKPPKEVIFWQNHVALKGDVAVCLWRFIKQLVIDEGDFPFSLVFKNMKHLPSAKEGRKVYALPGDIDNSMATFQDLSNRFAAAVLFPHDIGMISFDDLYAVGVPLFMPEPELVATIAHAHLVSTKNYPWYLLREEHASLHYARADGDQSPPWDPGWGWGKAVGSNESATYLGKGLEDPDLLRKAVATANFMLLPHVRHFGSLTSLLRDLWLLGPDELWKTREAMRRSSLEAWEVTAEFYRRAAFFLLGEETKGAASHAGA